MNNQIKKKLIEICGTENVNDDQEILEKYSKDQSLIDPIKPLLVVFPENTDQVQDIIKLANQNNISIIPISSPNKYRFHGDTVPKSDNTIIMNLSKMNKILRIDKKNRVIMVEPGVTFGELIDVAGKNGLRLLNPLFPRKSKSVLSSALEREPPIVPRFQWDSSDPLLCTEVIFGTGDYFRTGIAAGPGTIEEQIESGQAQKNPMGPTQFSPYRLIQGAQGCFGVVTWATIKCEYLYDTEKLMFSQSDNFEDFFDFMRYLIKYRTADEVFIVNKVNLAALLGTDISNLSNLKDWILITNFTGMGQFGKDRISYILADINDVINDYNIKLTKTLGNIDNSKIFEIIHGTCEESWRLKYKGGFQDIFYLTTLDKTVLHYNLVSKMTDLELGVYIQPINQGCGVHCEFDLYYNPADTNEGSIKKSFLEISKKLMDIGAFFNRPYGLWADEMYARVSNETISALRRVKEIFDPNNIMNRGALCFKEE
ncbi:MAG: FAD-binding oxidoreductase [Candidatus Helarchaeota archaeon]